MYYDLIKQRKLIFTYGLLVWGSKINTNHPLHLLQKRALRIVKNTDYVAHSEPICKDLRLLKMPDMFRYALIYGSSILN